MKILRLLDKTIERFSSLLLVVAFLSMLSLGLLSIGLRWFGVAFVWIDPLIRHLVFLSAFLGGVTAVNRGGHIAIDILDRNLKERGKDVLRRNLKRVVFFVTSAIVAWFALSSWTLVTVEMEYGRPVFWAIHSGFLVAIIPVGLSMIGYRFLFLLIASFQKEG